MEATLLPLPEPTVRLPRAEEATMISTRRATATGMKMGKRTVEGEEDHEGKPPSSLAMCLVLQSLALKLCQVL